MLANVLTGVYCIPYKLHCQRTSHCPVSPLPPKCEERRLWATFETFRTHLCQLSSLPLAVKVLWAGTLQGITVPFTGLDRFNKVRAQIDFKMVFAMI